MLSKERDFIVSLYKQKGVYCIYNTITQKKYIGYTSLNFGDRRDSHFASLRNGYHFNKEMQKDYDRFGESSFEFQIVETIDSDDVWLYEDKEKYWIKALDTFENGYNETAGGIGASGTTLPPERIQQLSEVNRKRMQGAKFSDDTKKAMSEAREKNRKRYTSDFGILTEKEVYDIRLSLMQGIRVADLAQKYNVTVQCISKINVGRNWKGICPPGWKEYLDK